jgi:CheY-like chemotaxis protein
MELLSEEQNRRILVIDDNEAVHNDFRKILSPDTGDIEIREMAAELFDDAPPATFAPDTFEVHTALQGQEGFEMVRRAVDTGRPYAVAFVDVRMPPGWNGIETVSHIWSVDHEIEIVLCTAYSDFSWEQIVSQLRHPDRLLILKKPFDNVEVRQMAHSLTAKWALRRKAACRLQDLEIMVEERTHQLASMGKRVSR